MESNRRKREDISTNKEKGEKTSDNDTNKSRSSNKIAKLVPDEEVLTDTGYGFLQHDETSYPLIARSSSEQSLNVVNNNNNDNQTYQTTSSITTGNPSITPTPLLIKVNTNDNNLITRTTSNDFLSRVNSPAVIGTTNTTTTNTTTTNTGATATAAGTGTSTVRPVRAAVPWDDMFQLLLAHHSTHGNCNVTKRGTTTLGEREIKLGQWLSDQRKAYFKHKLAPDRLTRIQGLVDRGVLKWDSNIKSDPLEERWDKSFDALVEYGKKHGNCNVPREHSVEEANGTVGETATTTLKLGVWLHKQRTDFKNNKLEARKSLKLQELVDKQLMVWDQKGDQESARWDTYHNALLAYMSRYGHCNVPPKGLFYLEDDQVCKLGFWLKTQRIQLKKGKLKKERLEKLQKLADAGFLALEEATTTQVAVQQGPVVVDEEEYYSDDYDQAEQDMFMQ